MSDILNKSVSIAVNGMIELLRNQLCAISDGPEWMKVGDFDDPNFTIVVFAGGDRAREMLRDMESSEEGEMHVITYLDGEEFSGEED